MKKILIIMVAVLAFTLMSCVKNLDKYGFAKQTTLKGRVIDKTLHTPLKEVTVSVSDGTHIHSSYITGENGRFELPVVFDDVNGNYKLNIVYQGHSPVCEELKGMGQNEYDYKDILYDNTQFVDYVEIPTANLMVQKKDLGWVSWETAMRMCASSTVANYTDWRLPSLDELMVLYNNREYIGGFNTSSYHTYYWSSTKTSDNASRIDFSDGNVVDWPVSSASVRAVRNIDGGGSVGTWLYYGDYNNHMDCWGLVEGGSNEWAVMFPSFMISQYSGYSITKIRAYCGETGTYTLKLYKGGTSQPNTQIKLQRFNVSSTGWNIITLSSPITLTTNESLWASLSLSYTAGHYPEGACNGINNRNARWTYNEVEGWCDVYDYNEQVDLCWEIQVYITNTVKGKECEEISLMYKPINNDSITHKKVLRKP